VIRRRFRVWHQGWPGHPVLWAKDPPGGDGRYHRAGSRATWYGSTTERGAWAEFFRHLEDDVSPFEFYRRVGRVDYSVLVLDLTSRRLREALGVTRSELTGDDLPICQALADLAAGAGFEAIRGPSGALDTEVTLAVFDSAIVTRAAGVLDKGRRTAPLRLAVVLRAVHVPPATAPWLGRRYDEIATRIERARGSRRRR